MQLIKHRGNRLISYFADNVYRAKSNATFLLNIGVSSRQHIKNDILFPFMYPDMQAGPLVVLLYNCKGALKNN